MNQFAFTDDLISLPVEVTDKQTYELPSQVVLRFDTALLTLSDVSAATPS